MLGSSCPNWSIETFWTLSEKLREEGETGEGGSRAHRGYFTQSPQRAEFLVRRWTPARSGRLIDREGRPNHKRLRTLTSLAIGRSSRSMPRVARPTASLTFAFRLAPVATSRCWRDRWLQARCRAVRIS